MEHFLKTNEDSLGSLKQMMDANSKVLDVITLELQDLRARIATLENKLTSTIEFSDIQGETVTYLSNHLKTHDEQLGMVDRNLELHLQYIAMLNEKISK